MSEAHHSRSSEKIQVQQISAVDRAYYAALTGNTSFSEALPLHQQNLVRVASEVLLGKNQKTLPWPAPKELATLLKEQPSLAALQLTALYLGEHHKTLAHKTGTLLTSATKVSPGIIPGAAFGLAGKIVDGIGYHRAAQTARVAEQGFALPHIIIDEITRYPIDSLTAAASNLVKHEYYDEYHTPKHLAPWLFARMLEIATQFPENEVPDRYWNSLSEYFQKSYANATIAQSAAPWRYTIKNEHGEPLVAATALLKDLNVALQTAKDTQEIRNATKKLREDAQKDREARRKWAQEYQEQRVPMESKRPYGEELKQIKESSIRYTAWVTNLDSINDAYTTWERCFENILNNPFGSVEHDEYLSLLAAIQERSLIAGKEQAEFHKLYQEAVARFPYLKIFKKDINSASTATIQLLTSAFHPTYGDVYTIPAEYAKLNNAKNRLDQAAFDWFDQFFDKKANTPQYQLFRDVLREAYLLDRLRLAESTDGAVNEQRANRFLAIVHKAQQSRKPRIDLPENQLQPIITWALLHGNYPPSLLQRAATLFREAQS